MVHNVPKIVRTPVINPITKEAVLDNEGKPMIAEKEDGKERAVFVAKLPFINDEHLLNTMRNPDLQQKFIEYLVTLVNGEIKSLAQYAINNAKRTGAELTQAIFNTDEMQLAYLINKPKAVSKELWIEFAESYINVMTKPPINHRVVGATNASKALAVDKLESFQGASDEQLDKFNAVVNIYFANCGAELAQKYSGIYKYLTDTIASYKAKDFSSEFE